MMKCILSAGTAVALLGFLQVLPAQTTVVATRDLFKTGSVTTGSYLSTHDVDTQREVLREAESGGKPSKRTSELDHAWDFGTLPSGDTVKLLVRASRSDNSEGDNFDFEYSTNSGQSWAATGCTISDSVMPEQELSVDLPASVAGGSLWIRAVDSDRSQGNKTLDTLTVDYLAVVIGTASQPGSPDEIFVEGQSTSTMMIGWADVQGEAGYRIERDDGSGPVTVGMLPADSVLFLDEGLSESTSYSYRVVAFDSSNVDLPVPPGQEQSGTTRAAEDFAHTFHAPGTALGGHDVDVSGALGVAWQSAAGIMFSLRNPLDGFWMTDLVAGSSGWREGGQFLFAPDGTPTIVYSLDRKIHFAEKRGGSWSTRVVDDFEIWAADVKLAFDPEDPLGRDLAIAYERKTGAHRTDPAAIFVARRIGGSWNRELATEVTYTSAQPSLVFDGTGAMVLAIRSQSNAMTNTIQIVRRNATGWSAPEFVDSAKGWGFVSPTLSVDPITGEAQIAYVTYPNARTTGTAGIRFASRSGNLWVIESLRDIEYHPAGVELELTHGIGGTAYLAVSLPRGDPSEGQYLMKRVAAAWSWELVNAWALSGQNSVAVDVQGRLSLCYATWYFDPARQEVVDSVLGGLVLTER